MGSILSGPPKPPAIPVPPPAATPATAANPSVAQSAANARNRAAAAASNSGTTSTGPQGLSQPPKTANATLLGE